MSVFNVVSFVGIAVLLTIAWVLSGCKRPINWRLAIFGVLLQCAIASVIFVFPPGARLFLMINELVVQVMNSAMAGAEFVFGRLALPPGRGESLGFFLAFQGLPTIIFFSALMAILYYYGIMQTVIRLFARLFTRLFRVSGAESLCAASNIFVGVESSLTIRPYLERMTQSELTTILAAGMSTVSSNILAVYVFSLNDQFPTIAAHLVSASFLSAPAALVMSKLIVPETEIPETSGKDIPIFYEREETLFTAIINGANTGLRLIAGIVALLIAVLGLVALANMVIGGIGSWITATTGIALDWSIEGILGYLFYPFALIIGVPPADAFEIGRILGSRTIVTELAGYQELAGVMASGTLQYGRSAVLCAYALCGFAHVASIAIFIGGISAVAPKTTNTLSRVAFKALAAAVLACLMTACIAGTFYSSGSILFGR